MFSRGRNKYLYLFLILLLVFNSHASTPIIQEASKEHKKDIANSNAGEISKHEGHKGETVKKVESAISDKSSDEFSKVKDLSEYADKDVKLKQVGEAGSFEGHNLKKDAAEDLHSVGFNKKHKKGHHNQGFTNSYHKDESSNKSTFFDDFVDEGDQAVYNKNHKSHDVKDGRQFQGSSKLNDELAHKKVKQGGYDHHGGHQNKAAGHSDYGKQYHLDDRQNYNKWKQGQSKYDRDQHYGRQQSYVPVAHGWGGTGVHGLGHDVVGYQDGIPIDLSHGYDQAWHYDRNDQPAYDDELVDDRIEPPPSPPAYSNYEESRIVPPRADPIPIAQRKQTITIYEDPRYDAAESRKDYVDPKLEVRPSRHRYEYDDTYYAPARRDARGGISKESQVNKLVYNYRRQR